MSFPDQLHIDLVNEALWRSGGAGASVMVGSGFSQNARNTVSNGRPVPMLQDIADALFRALTPGGAIKYKPRPEQAMRLAQEFEVEFGATALHHKLRCMISDRDYVPMEAHKRLLRLPWADVFTTNWDTLLERTCDTVPERPYAVIRTNADIPWSTRPRIIKLHGALPDPPLILTEESYRRYPQAFAPLVNTVQQAMMETVVLLLGFSGSDPNFLYWSGWVRDNLGDTAPKVYLAGHLKLSRSERRMLETGYSVIPIDLAEHPRAAEWPEHLRHELATDWILSALEHGKPYDQTQWPTPPRDASDYSANPLLEPIGVQATVTPIGEPYADLPQQASTAESLRQTKKTLERWRHNRTCYPGWIVFPSHIRNSARRSVEHWTPFILGVLPEMQILERLYAIYEINWRLEKSLARIPEDLETSAQSLIDTIDCQVRTIDGKGIEGTAWTKVRSAWREIALSLLTAARYRLDFETFQDRLLAIDPYLDDDPDTRHRVHHERCLSALWSLDYESLAEHLERWRLGDADAMWMVRKGALLRDIGKTAEADKLVKEALTEIRALPRSDGNLRGPSQEGWALWSTRSPDKYQNVDERWRHLAPLKCDPLMDFYDLVRNLEVADADGKSAPNFDLDVQTTHSPMWVSRPSHAVAYQSIRLTEVAGLPQSVGIMTVARSLLECAAERLAVDDSQLAIRLILRTVTYDQSASFQRVLSRDRVASCSKQEAESLCKAAGQLTTQAIHCIEKTTHGRIVPWVERAGVAMEGWSRLALRADGEAVDGIFRCALKLHRSRVVVSNIDLHDPLWSLLRRSWEAMSQRQKTKWILEILETPTGRDGETGVMSKYPDPGWLLFRAVEPPERDSGDNGRWTRVIGTLIDAVSRTDATRRLAARRIYAITVWGVLTESETTQVAEALWGPGTEDNRTLPFGTALRDYAFIVLPEPREGLGRMAFGRKWLMGDIAKVKLTQIYETEGEVGLSVTHDNPLMADDILYQVGCAMNFLRTRGLHLDLSSTEEEYLLAVIELWAETNLSLLRAIADFVREPYNESLKSAVYGLSCLLPEVRVATSLGRKLCERVTELNDNGIPAYGILPGVLKSVPELSDDVNLLMSAALVSDDRNVARSALHSLHRWLVWASDVTISVPSPPEHLVREVGLAISTRRRTVIASALGVAKWIFEKGSVEQREVIHDLVLKGMEYLVNELRYDREDTDTGLPDIPLTRWRCIELARTLARQESEVPVVRRWLEIGRDDPLPEVRRVAESWYEERRIGG